MISQFLGDALPEIISSFSVGSILTKPTPKNPDDSNSNPSECRGAGVSDLAAAPNGKVYLAGRFCFNQRSPMGLAEISNGVATPLFLSNSHIARREATASIVVPSQYSGHSGNLLLGGGTGWNFFMRKPDETLEEKFPIPFPDVRSFVMGITEDPSSGSFFLNGAPRCIGDENSCGVPLTKHLASGGIDSAFKPQSFDGGESGGALYLVQKTVLDLAKGALYVVGSFTSYGKTPGTSSLIRINAKTGALDNTFQPKIEGIDLQYEGGAYPFNNRIFGLHKNGKLYVANVNYTKNIYNQKPLVRLNADGSIDNSFVLSSQVKELLDFRTRSMAFSPSGRIYLTATCNSNHEERCIVAITENGSIDLSFQIIRIKANKVFLAVTPDESLYVAGWNLMHPSGGYTPLLGYSSTGQLKYSFPELRFQ